MRLFDLPYYQLENYPSDKAFNYKVGSEWKSISTKEFVDDIQMMSNALITLGVKPKENIAIVVHVNLYEWHVLDMAFMQIGAVGVPLYPTLAEKDFKYVLKHSECKYCFASNIDLYNKIENILDSTDVEHLYSLDEKVSVNNYQSLIELGRQHDCTDEIETRKTVIKEDDLASIVYTSGTTGNPKGAMLAHKTLAFTSTVMAPKILDITPGNSQRVLSYLPINHIFERMATYLYMFMGYEIYFAESIEKLSVNLQEVKPMFIPVVPRLVEKIFDKIIEKGEEQTGIKKIIFFWALGLAKKYDVKRKMPLGYRLKHKIADKLIFSKWRAVFGGELKFMVSGSAPLQSRFVTIFKAAGLPIVEGYGMTESAAIISGNDFREGKIKLKSVGIPIDDIDVKIAKDGEILVKGDNVFIGYYKDTAKTKEALVDGYLHTGDIGVVDEEGFLLITDRKKEMFKTSGGKYIAPAIIENQLKQSPFIEQIVVVGEGERFTGALIQVNYEKVDEWAKYKKIKVDKYDSNPKVIDKIQREIDKYNIHLGKWEQVKRFQISPDEWTVNDGHLTPTLKAKRKVIIAKYKDLIEKIYK